MPLPREEKPSDPTYALSIGGEFSGWDVNVYAAYIYDDSNVIADAFDPNARIVHRKTPMFGTAMNYLSGSWLFKTKAAYFSKLYHTLAPGQTLGHLDILAGVEYNGIADTMISYDVSLRHYTTYDTRMAMESIVTPTGQTVKLIPTDRDTYQHVLHIRTNVWNDTLHLNNLISLFANDLMKGDLSVFGSNTTSTMR